MIKSLGMLSFTSYSYPKSQSVKEIMLSSMAAGTLVYLFLIVFQPFGTENFHHPYKYLILFPYTLIFGSAFLHPVFALPDSKIGILHQSS